jgi:hypothetical protein
MSSGTSVYRKRSANATSLAVWRPKQELRCWDLPQVDWPVADRLVRVVKTVRVDHKRQVTVNQDGEHLKKSKTDVAVESTNWRQLAPNQHA